jgi:hypothetical protein
LEQEAAAGFDRLITHLFDDVIPNLERFPKMGRDFLAREPLSEEGRAAAGVGSEERKEYRNPRI